MQCPKCGSALGPNAAFCPTCGSNLGAPGSQMPMPGMPPMPMGMPIEQRTSGMAIAGLVCAFFCSLLGLIFSIVGLNEIKKSNGTVGGKGIAMAGLILSLLHIVAAIVVVIFVVFAAKRGVQEIDHKLKSAEADLQMETLAMDAKSTVITDSKLPVVDEPLTPAKPCCSFPGHECPANDADWTTPGWQALHFSVYGTHAFQYKVHSDGHDLEAEAVGDLDCDGTKTSIRLHVSIDASGNPTSSVTTN